MDRREQTNEYLTKLKSGDRSCFTEFFRFASGYVEYMAKKYLNDKTFVDDVVVSTFHKVLLCIHNFKEEENGFAWMCKIAQNESFRVNMRERRYTSEKAVEVLSTETYPNDDDDVDSVDIYYAMQTLSDIEQRIVEMRVFDDAKFEDIVAATGIPLTTVHRWYNNALKKLLKKLT